jgi:hypothetical protein
MVIMKVDIYKTLYESILKLNYTITLFDIPGKSPKIQHK